MSMLLDIMVEGADGRSLAVMELLEKAFQPLGGLSKWLDSHLSLLCGDGAYIPGGSEARHRGGSLKDIWGHRACRNCWDDFHCLNKAMEYTVKKSDMMERFFKMLNLSLDHMFL